MVHATAPLRQQDTGLGLVKHLPWRVLGLQVLPQALARLGSKRSYSPDQVMHLHGEDSELLVTAAITASMAGDLPGIALANGLPKRLYPRHQLAVCVIGVTHRLFCQTLATAGALA
jgi:hypothetical protein